MAPEDALLIVVIISVAAFVVMRLVVMRLSGHKCELIGGPMDKQDVNLPSLPKLYVVRDSIYKRETAPRVARRSTATLGT